MKYATVCEYCVMEGVSWEREQAPGDGVKPSQFCKRRGCLSTTESRPTKTTVLRTTRH